MKVLKKLVKPVILCLIVVVLGYSFIAMDNTRSLIVYSEHLSDTVATIDDAVITFEDLAFYILYEERVVEEQAMIYNPDSTKDYWNVHTNDTFIQEEAKECVIGMAVHDRFMYDLAVQEGLDTLTSEEEQKLEFARTDFWEDLLDQQWDRLPVSEDIINEQIRKAAVAEKYQIYLGESLGPSEAAYKYDGYYYQQMLAEHNVVYNDKLLDRFVLGDVTIYHDKVNFINGLTDEEKEENKNK